MLKQVVYIVTILFIILFSSCRIVQNTYCLLFQNHNINDVFALRLIVDAPWYVPNLHIRRDLQLSSVKEEISRSSLRYYQRLTTHPNDQVLALMAIPGTRRLRRHAPSDLPGRFMFTV
jgi:hypothetical protein